jgi:hypothetical protein
MALKFLTFCSRERQRVDEPPLAGVRSYVPVQSLKAKSDGCKESKELSVQEASIEAAPGSVSQAMKSSSGFLLGELGHATGMPSGVMHTRV